MKLNFVQPWATSCQSVLTQHSSVRGPDNIQYIDVRLHLIRCQLRIADELSVDTVMYRRGVGVKLKAKCGK